MRDNSLHPLCHIRIIPHQNRAGVAGHRLGQALLAVRLHIAEHRAHQVDQVVDDALVGCGGEIVEGDQVPVDDRAVGKVLVGVGFVLHWGDYTESARGFSAFCGKWLLSGFVGERQNLGQKGITVMQRGGAKSLHIGRNLLDMRPVFSHQQNAKRANAHNLIMLCNCPGTAVVNQQDISRELFIESHRFQLSLS